ncbi:hypothetical protein CHUAL_001480 [Chamberlinius hualienensis]
MSSSGVKNPSELSYDTTASGGTKRSGQLKADLTVAENPLCPSVRGLCCLILLFNLAAILICLGFVVVCQFYEPLFAWWIGLVILIFGFLTLIGCFIYCFVICKEHKEAKEQRVGPPELQWDHHWTKTWNFGHIDYLDQQKEAHKQPPQIDY